MKLKQIKHTVLSPKPIRPSIRFIKETLGENLKGAEIGILVGNHTIDVCNYLKPKHYWCIDSWTKDYLFRMEDNSRQNFTGRQILDIAIKRLAPIENTTIAKATSMEGLKYVNDGSLDFVYIDADHSGLMVKQDITQWRKKVRKGGVVAGHDFGYRREPELTNSVLKYAALNKIRLMCEPYDWWFINV